MVLYFESYNKLFLRLQRYEVFVLKGTSINSASNFFGPLRQIYRNPIEKATEAAFKFSDFQVFRFSDSQIFRFSDSFRSDLISDYIK